MPPFSFMPWPRSTNPSAWTCSYLDNQTIISTLSFHSRAKIHVSHPPRRLCEEPWCSSISFCRFLHAKGIWKRNGGRALMRLRNECFGAEPNTSRNFSFLQVTRFAFVFCFPNIIFSELSPPRRNPVSTSLKKKIQT